MKKLFWAYDQSFSINVGYLFNSIQFRNKILNWLESVVKMFLLEICYRLEVIHKFKAHLNVNYVKRGR